MFASFLRTKVYPIAAATANDSIPIPNGEALMASPLLKITNPTPNIETRIPNIFILVIFSFKKKDEVNDVNNGIVAIITAARVDETNFIP